MAWRAPFASVVLNTPILFYNWNILHFEKHVIRLQDDRSRANTQKEELDRAIAQSMSEDLKRPNDTVSCAFLNMVISGSTAPSSLSRPSSRKGSPLLVYR